MGHCTELPEWEETRMKEITSRAGLSEDLDPLEYFIFEYEPQEGSGIFREDLSNLIDFLVIGKVKQ